METSTKKSVRKTDAPARLAGSQTQEASGPIWKSQHNRVQGAMWKHNQEDGKTRFTISVSRSYKDKETDKWMNVHYFDRQDLKDVHSICDEAEKHILSLDGMTVEPGED
jgi:hypothetical protein